MVIAGGAQIVMTILRSVELLKKEEEKMSKIIFASSLLILLMLGAAACDNNGMTGNTNSSATTMSDSDLETAIKNKFDADTNLRAANLDIDADAEKNSVTLSGKVESQALRTKAVELAKSAHAGMVVTDKIDVVPREITRADYTEDMAVKTRENAKERGDTLGSSLDDAWIHTKIVTQLIGNTDTPERKINVDVVNNVVTLRGTVENNEQKMEAERVAKETDGVKSVKNMLKIKAT